MNVLIANCNYLARNTVSIQEKTRPDYEFIKFLCLISSHSRMVFEVACAFVHERMEIRRS